LRRLNDNGLIDRLTRGHYAIRPLGSLGTSTATDNLSLAVGAAFEGREHRIAYLSALSELGLLSHPVRIVFVACTQQVRLRAVSHRPLRVVVERTETIHVEAEAAGRSWRSTLERALFECALRVDLTGGVQRLAEVAVRGALAVDSARIVRLAEAFGARGLAAERRLASLARALALPLGLEPKVGPQQPLIRLGPRRRPGRVGRRKLPGCLEYHGRRGSSRGRKLVVLTHHALPAAPTQTEWTQRSWSRTTFSPRSSPSQSRHRRAWACGQTTFRTPKVRFLPVTNPPPGSWRPPASPGPAVRRQDTRLTRLVRRRAKTVTCGRTQPACAKAAVALARNRGGTVRLFDPGRF